MQSKVHQSPNINIIIIVSVPVLTRDDIVDGEFLDAINSPCRDYCNVYDTDDTNSTLGLIELRFNYCIDLPMYTYNILLKTVYSFLKNEISYVNEINDTDSANHAYTFPFL